jgi:uncharacterized protein (DUF1697 family)
VDAADGSRGRRRPWTTAERRASPDKPELFKVAGSEIYAWHPNGQGKSPLAAAIGKLPLRGAVTTRNANTVLKLLEMLARPV